MTESAPFLSIIIPAYNEAQRIGPTLTQIAAYLPGLPGAAEVLVVDDASTDHTAAVVQDFAAVHPAFRLLALTENRGKGGAVQHGMQHAAGRFVLFMDADSSTKITEFEKFRPLLEAGFGVVIGTRRKPRSDVVVQQPGHRQFLGRVFTRLACALLGLRVSDITCGFKCFRRDVAQALSARQTIHGWAFDAELLFLAHRWGYRVAEVPVTWLNEPGSKVRASRDAVTSFTELLRIRWNARQGKYDPPTPNP